MNSTQSALHTQLLREGEIARIVGPGDVRAISSNNVAFGFAIVLDNDSNVVNYIHRGDPPFHPGENDRVLIATNKPLEVSYSSMYLNVDRKYGDFEITLRFRINKEDKELAHRLFPLMEGSTDNLTKERLTEQLISITKVDMEAFLQNFTSENSTLRSDTEFKESGRKALARTLEQYGLQFTDILYRRILKSNMETSGRTDKPKRGRWILGTAGVVAMAVVVGAVAIWFGMRDPQTTGIQVIAPDPITPPLTDQIVFHSYRVDRGNFEIYTVDLEDENLRPITSLEDDGSNTHASWSPNKTHIAFVSSRDGDSEIWVMNADGSNPHQITMNNNRDDFPAWSPDGTRIAFASDEDGDLEIWVMDVDGSNPRQITNNDVRDVLPSWSPDGEKLVFQSGPNHPDDGGDHNIWTVNIDDPNPRQITMNNGDNESPNWSPDGESIAFCSNRDGDYEIYTIDPDGANALQVTRNDDYTDCAPVWSPDSTRIAFHSNRDGDYEIWITNGSDTRQITDNDVRDRFPDW